MSPSARAHRRLVVAAVLLGPALGMAACGSRARLSKAAYEQKVTAIGNSFTSTLQQVFSSPQLKNPTSLKQAAEIIRKGADVVRNAADQLDALAPPAQADHAHGLLVEGFREFAKDMDGFADDAAAGKIAEINAFDQQVSSQTLPSMVKIKQAIDELTAKGFHVGQ